jgi:hypothetical protein
VRLPAGATPAAAFLDELRLKDHVGAEVPVSGRLLEWIWDLMLETPDQVARDLASPGAAVPDLPPGVYRLGDGPLILGRGRDVVGESTQEECLGGVVDGPEQGLEHGGEGYRLLLLVEVKQTDSMLDGLAVTRGENLKDRRVDKGLDLVGDALFGDSLEGERELG